jgi:transposase
VDRELLERLLEEGLSLAEIGRRVDRHESTVAYWLAQHGLEANGRDRHLAKGALDRAELEALVQRGLSIAQIASETQRGKATVRHWLREYGLRTARSGRDRGSVSVDGTTLRRCPRHGLVEFKRRPDGGTRCVRCRVEAVTRRRRKVKQTLVEEAGGACELCGYDRCLAALEFHHLEPEEKRFQMSARYARSLDRARAEARKCALLCASCHAEVEAGVAVLPPGGSGS